MKLARIHKQETVFLPIEQEVQRTQEPVWSVEQVVQHIQELQSQLVRVHPYQLVNLWVPMELVWEGLEYQVALLHNNRIALVPSLYSRIGTSRDCQEGR